MLFKRKERVLDDLESEVERCVDKDIHHLVEINNDSAAYSIFSIVFKGLQRSAIYSLPDSVANMDVYDAKRYAAMDRYFKSGKFRRHAYKILFKANRTQHGCSFPDDIEKAYDSIEVLKKPKYAKDFYMLYCYRERVEIETRLYNAMCAAQAALLITYGSAIVRQSKENGDRASEESIANSVSETAKTAKAFEGEKLFCQADTILISDAELLAFVKATKIAVDIIIKDDLKTSGKAGVNKILAALRDNIEKGIAESKAAVKAKADSAVVDQSI